MSLTSGAQLGAYEIVSLLGAGGMGEVYRARDTRWWPFQTGRDALQQGLTEWQKSIGDPNLKDRRGMR